MSDNDHNPASNNTRQVEIQLDETTAQGRYANLFMVHSTPTEVIIDFAFLQPQQSQGKVQSRVILTSESAQRLLAVLSEQFGNAGPGVGPAVRLSITGGDAPN